MRIYFGTCQITVTGVAALYPQRVVVRIKNGADVVIPGVVGETYRVDAEQWELLLQHEVDGAWRENIRAIAGKWTPHGEANRQVIRSKDRDWPTDRIERNLVVTLERGGPAAVRRLDAPASLSSPHARATQSTDATAFPAAPTPAVAPTSATERSHQTATSADGYIW